MHGEAAPSRAVFSGFLKHVPFLMFSRSRILFGVVLLMRIGLAGSAAASVLMGLADSYSAALTARLLDGFFCGNECVANTYLGELVNSENVAGPHFKERVGLLNVTAAAAAS